MDLVRTQEKLVMGAPWCWRIQPPSRHLFLVKE